MAISTLGTNANNSIPLAIRWTPGVSAPGGNGGIAAADFAALNAAIKDDLNGTHPQIPFSLDSSGRLFVPNRGSLMLLPGDWVGIDSRGWPILLSADTVANGLWTHNP